MPINTTVGSDSPVRYEYVGGDEKINNVTLLSEIPANANGVYRLPSGEILSYVDGVSVGARNVILSSSNTATQNSAILQEAIDAGGLININTPGTYLLGDGPKATPAACLFFAPTTKIVIGAGVTLKHTLNKSLFINGNWKTNRVAITAVTYNYDQDIDAVPATGQAVATYNTGVNPHGFSVGDMAYIKNDTSDQINGFFKVIAIDNTDTNNRKFKVYRYGRNAATPFLAFTGTPIVYLADALISVTGDGQIDYDVNGGIDLQLMGSIINKCADVTWTIRTVRSGKYGLYISNTGKFVGSIPKAESLSNAIQFIGPAENITINEIYGESSDDPFAITTSNAGYTQYDLLDTDGQKNSDGPVKVVRIRDAGPKFTKTRGILLAASAAGNIEDVVIDTITATSSAIVPALKIDNVPGDTCNVAVSINHVVIEASNTTVAPITVGGNSAATFTTQLHVGSIICKAKAGTTGMQRNLIDLYQNTINCAINIDSVYTEVDLSGSANIAVVEAVGSTGGNHAINIGKLTVKSTGTTRTFRGVKLNHAGAASQVQIGQFNGSGPNIGGVSAMLMDGHTANLGTYVINSTSGSNSYAFESDRAGQFGVGRYVARGSGARGLINHYPATALVAEVSCGTVDMAASATIIAAMNSATSRLLLTVNGGNANTCTFTQSAGALLRLSGQLVASTLTFDGTKLDPTAANHASGASFYNNNAAYGTGVGFYVNGSAGFAKLA